MVLPSQKWKSQNSNSSWFNSWGHLKQDMRGLILTHKISIEHWSTEWKWTWQLQSRDKPFPQQTFWLVKVGKAQVPFLTFNDGFIPLSWACIYCIQHCAAWYQLYYVSVICFFVTAQWDKITDRTVGYVVFIMLLFHSLCLISFMTNCGILKLKNHRLMLTKIICVVHGTIQTGSGNELSVHSLPYILLLK